MKNATKHADDLRTMFKRLMREQRPEPRVTQDPLKALVRGAMSFDVSDARAEEAMRLIDREFVDLNEFRVATELEVHVLLGQRYPSIERRVGTITQALNAVFEREHTMSLERLRAISKRDARQFVRDLPGVTPFVEAYVMLFAFDGHAVPIDEAMLAYLRDAGILEGTTDADEAQRFVEHAVKAEESYDLYACLRRAAHGADEGAKGRKKAKA